MENSLPKYITLTEDNIDKEHICCAFSDKKCLEGYESKKEWLKKEFANGYVFIYIPYAVNLALDEASGSIGKHLITFLKNNAETLRMNLNHAAYPAMYCNYWWGEMWKSSEPASMGAQVSGASLMEGIARLE